MYEEATKQKPTAVFTDVAQCSSGGDAQGSCLPKRLKTPLFIDIDVKAYLAKDEQNNRPPASRAKDQSRAARGGYQRLKI